jgi:predicted HNH restriction endonuclease
MNWEWKRQEVILLFYTVCSYPSEKFHLEKSDHLAIINELAGLLQKPPSMVSEKIQHLLYLNSSGQYGKWSGGTKVDREVFEEFSKDKERLGFVATKIKEELQKNLSNYEDIFTNFDQAEAKEIERLKKEGWAEEVGNLAPSLQYRTIRQHERIPTVSAIAKLRADFKCEIQGCNYEPFIGLYDLPYVEVHHIKRLADGGEDTLKNVACLCPKHHREIHFGLNKEKLREILLRKRHEEIK